MIEYNEYEPHQSEEVARLLHQLGYNVSAEELPARIEKIKEYNKGTLFIALKNKDVVGCIHTMIVTRLAEGTCGEVVSLVIDENTRGEGIGKGLIEKSIGWLKEHGQTKLRIRCNSIREEAHNFYNHLGFTEKKSQKVFEKNI